jgi:hypothetical protein
MQICGIGNHSPKVHAIHINMTVGMNGQVQVALSQQQALSAPAPCALLPLGKVHVPYPPSSVHRAGSYYSCPGWLSVEDQIYLVAGYNPITQK